MPEGPLGGPRLTSLGPLVDEEKTDEELFNEMVSRSHSYRNYNPEEFHRLAKSDEISLGRLRTLFNSVEAGRFENFMDDMSSFWFPLDQDEKELFYERNPGLVQWFEAWTTMEELRPPSEDIGEVF